MTTFTVDDTGMSTGQSRHPVARAMRLTLLALWGGAGILSLFNYFVA